MLMVQLLICGNAACLALGWRQNIDLQSDAHYSRNNFTDIKKPYDGVDAWGEFRFALWPKTGPQVSPYVTVTPVTTTESDEFWWQQNYTGAVGLQLYPVDLLSPRKEGGHDELHWFRSVRLYSTYGVREYYDKPRNTDPQDHDFRVGFDFYRDNLFAPEDPVLTYLIWTNLTYRSTNYSLNNYNALLWEGNAKLGPQLRLNDNKSILLPYGFVDWTVADDHNNRWWENFIRLGAGIRLYPKVSGLENKQLEDILRRFNIYAEALRNVSWTGDDAPSSVRETDWRIGINFSTFWD